jgi:hypothetical protein
MQSYGSFVQTLIIQSCERKGLWLHCEKLTYALEVSIKQRVYRMFLNTEKPETVGEGRHAKILLLPAINTQ